MAGDLNREGVVYWSQTAADRSKYGRLLVVGCSVRDTMKKIEKEVDEEEELDEERVALK